jgi:hypothetical protein
MENIVTIYILSLANDLDEARKLVMEKKCPEYIANKVPDIYDNSVAISVGLNE